MRIVLSSLNCVLLLICCKVVIYHCSDEKPYNHTATVERIKLLIEKATNHTTTALGGFDSDEKRDSCQLVKARGFGCEVHLVTTGQNYQVELHRIVSVDGRSDATRRPVILQPGLIGTSADFIMASSEVSSNVSEVEHNMGFELAKQGFDVWLSNNRGNQYGLRHLTLDAKDKPFWEFTWDEISEYDTPFIVNYVQNYTKAKKVGYVGHSQGTAVMFALLSRNNSFDASLEPYIAISPITRIGGATTTFRPLIALLKPYLKLHGGSMFMKNPVLSDLTAFACSMPISNQICKEIFMSVVGHNNKELNMSRLDVYVEHMPSSTSSRNLLHFDQMFNTNQFKHYDFGYTKNLKIYGQLTAPVYDLTKITHPSMHVLYGGNDGFIPQDSIKALEKDLTGAKEFYKLKDPKANHMDPLIGIKSAIEVNQKVIDILEQYE